MYDMIFFEEGCHVHDIFYHLELLIKEVLPFMMKCTFEEFILPYVNVQLLS